MLRRETPTMETCRRCAAKVPWYAFFGNIALTLYKIVVGYLGSSPALIADGVHSFTDVIGTGVILLSTRVASRPADARHPFGYGKVEFMSSLFIYVVLILLSILIFIGGLVILTTGHYHAPHLVTFFAGLISAVYNLMLFRLGQCAGNRTTSPALLANSFESRADAISSVAVCIGILFAITIHPAADPIAAMVVGVVIFINCIQEGRKAVGGLMDESVSPPVVARIRRFIEEQPSVEAVQFLRVRPTGNGYWLDVGIGVAPQTAADRAQELAAEVRQAVLARSRQLSAVEVYVAPHAPAPAAATTSIREE